MWICVRFAHFLDCGVRWCNGDQSVTMWQWRPLGHGYPSQLVPWGAGHNRKYLFWDEDILLWSPGHTITQCWHRRMNGQGWHNGWGLDGGRWWILARCVSPQDGGILTKLTQWLTMVTIHPLAPILGVNSSTGASFQQAPYKYKLTTLTDISPCSLHLFKLEICQLLPNKSVLY